MRTASFWALVVLIPMAIFQVMNSSKQTEGELNYTEFREQLAADNVESVTIVDGQTIEGELRGPIQSDGASVGRFRTLLPMEATQELLDELQAAGVVTSAKESGNSWITILVSMLPWILIIGLWFFFFRQMQAGGSRAFSFGKSKAKLLTGDTPKVTFRGRRGCG